MIWKPRKIPIVILKFEALKRRTPPNHPYIEDVKHELGRWRAGFEGEESINYYFNQLDDNFLILQDLRIPINSHYVQIDVLILTPHCFLILEIKNLKGRINFVYTYNQLIRTVDGVEQMFDCPINQSILHKESFTEWLSSYGCPSIPIESKVILSNKRTIIDNNVNDEIVRKNVMRSPQLMPDVKSLEKKFPERKL